ncbi:MAG: hypothetical protein ACPGJV_02260 [Bacteriovoracaceae bacterium]
MLTLPTFETNSYKIYRGAYTYLKGTSIYSEETFEVFRERKDMSIHFVSELNTRVSTGELLNIKVNYFVNKDFIPLRVLIDKKLGSEHVAEYYVYEKRNDKIIYEFIDSVGTTTKELATPPKFHITTPTVSTSTAFLRSKKFDGNGLNHFTVWTSQNQWSYQTEPTTKNIHAKRMNTAHENIMIEGHNVQAVHYRIFEFQEDFNDGDVDTQPYVNIYLSKYAGIPYTLRSDADGTKIQIKYFNSLDDHT